MDSGKRKKEMVAGKRRLRGPDLLTSSDLWMKDPADSDEWRCLVAGADVRVITSKGRAIEAHSWVLAAASPVLESRLFKRPPKRHQNGAAILPIPGVPCDAVLAFLRCLYHGKMASLSPEDNHGTDNNKMAVNLLVLSHANRVPWLKRAAESALAATVQADDVADLLQLSRLCDAPRLRVRCLNYVRKESAAVEATEGWRFLRRWNPRLDAEVARFVKEAEKREERGKKRKEENRAYVELGDAVECLHHILRQGPQGCGKVGPIECLIKGEDKDCCPWGRTCEGLRALIRHYAACQQRRSSGGCARCRRMAQLVRLHSAVSYELDHCPETPPILASVSPMKTDEKDSDHDDGNIDEEMWRLLARKVVSAKLLSTVALSKSKRESVVADQGRRKANPGRIPTDAGFRVQNLPICAR